MFLDVMGGLRISNTGGPAVPSAVLPRAAGLLQGYKVWLSPALAASNARAGNTDAHPKAWLQPRDPVHAAVLHGRRLAAVAMEGPRTQKRRHEGSPPLLSQGWKHVLQPQTIYQSLCLLA